MPDRIPEQKAMTMKNALSGGMLEATRLTRTGRLIEATALLQRLLGGQLPGDADAGGCDLPTIDGVAEPPDATEAKGPIRARRTHAMAMPNQPRGAAPPDNRERFQLLRGGLSSPAPASKRVAIPKGGQFLNALFTNQAGSRPYKLYVPSGYDSAIPVPLIVMLHGCTQSPDDFAAGTRMNEVAEEDTFLVVYPGQTTSANMRKCWNWFNENDQRRDAGEPSLIAGITRAVMRDYTVDPRRIYVAGLSAGGAAAAIMGDAYPDLYAAVGVHSGLACGAAHDMPSAFVAMRQGRQGSAGRGIASSRSGTREPVPTIVFHGDRDTMVNPSNGDAVVAQSAGAATLRIRTDDGRVPWGHAYSRRVHADANGRTVIEQWVVHGGGHAWFGGSPAGSYTDPKGPDATREIVRFFLDPRPEFLATTR